MIALLKHCYMYYYFVDLYRAPQCQGGFYLFVGLGGAWQTAGAAKRRSSGGNLSGVITDGWLINSTNDIKLFQIVSNCETSWNGMAKGKQKEADAEDRRAAAADAHEASLGHR